MNIHKIGTDTNFKSGTTFKILKTVNTINVKNKEQDLLSRGIKADFKDNKSVCADFTFAFDILEKLSEQFKLPFFYKPPVIQVYNDKEIIFADDKQNLGIHIREKNVYLKKNKAFKEGTILINEDFNKNHISNDINSSMRGWEKLFSTGHFLHVTLHELMHNMELNQIYKKHGYRGLDKDLRKKYHKQFTPDLGKVMDETYNLMSLTRNERLFLKNDVSFYALCSRKWPEIYAELMTKLIVKSLNKKLIPVKNPLDFLPKYCPKYFKDLLEETLEV